MIYVDQVQNHGNKGHWCHMATDGSVDELHSFAQQIGLKREWFQEHRIVRHYDLKPSKRKLAVELGAIEVSSRELIDLCRIDIRPSHKGCSRKELVWRASWRGSCWNSRIATMM